MRPYGLWRRTVVPEQNVIVDGGGSDYVQQKFAGRSADWELRYGDGYQRRGQHFRVFAMCTSLRTGSTLWFSASSDNCIAANPDQTDTDGDLAGMLATHLGRATDCDGNVGSVDALKLLRHVANLAVARTNRVWISAWCRISA
jgi:hypothetical protein